ncbi:MAG: tetratricopeptide repeat protein [Lachnospiraceae bacterium]|nr:tetratricopeptide repeat protein [Lachnospiraceae bacterium]
MNQWEYLGIKKTKDMDVINTAYRELLKKTNPEDDQKEFMKLRKAYEDAVSYAKESEGQGEEKINFNYISHFQEIYDDFEKRVDTSCWEKAFENEVFTNLDTSADARIEAIKFFMLNPNLPDEVWDLIDDEFNISDDSEELTEELGKEMYDTLLFLINMERIDYRKFNLYADVDFDEYIDLLFDLSKTSMRKNEEEFLKVLEKMEDMGDVHPFTKEVKISYCIYKERYEEAYELATELYDEFDDVHYELLLAHISYYYVKSEKEVAKSLYKELIEKNPDNNNARMTLGYIYVDEGEYHLAYEMFEKLPSFLKSTDAEYTEKYELVCDKILEEFENNINNGVNYSIEEKIDKGLLYIERKYINKAIELIDSIDREESPLQYYKYVLKCYYADKKVDLFIKYFDEFFDYLSNLNDESISEVNNCYYYMANLSSQLELYERGYKAIETVFSGNSKDKNKDEFIDIKAELLYNLKRFSDLEKFLNSLSNKNCGEFSKVFYRTKIFAKRNDFLSAFEVIKRSPKSCNSLYEINVLKIYCAIKSHNYDYAASIIDYLNLGGNILDTIKDFIEHLLEYERLFDAFIEHANDYKKYEESARFFCEFADNFEELKDKNKFEYLKIRILIDKEDAYYQAAEACYKFKDYDKAYSYAKTAFLNEQESIRCQHVMADVLYEKECYKEAKEMFLKVYEYDHNDVSVIHKIAVSYEEEYDYDNALKYYDLVIKKYPGSMTYSNRGLLYMQLDQFEKAREDFFRAMEIEPNIYIYNNIGVTYQLEDNYDEALKYFKLAVDNFDEEVSPLPYRNMAAIYLRLKDYDKAVECYNCNIKIFNRPFDFEETARAYYMAQKYKESVEAYTRRCKCLDKNDFRTKIELYTWVAKCNLSIGAEKTALKYYMMAISECRNNKYIYEDAFCELADLYAIKNMYEEAAKYYSYVADSDISVMNRAQYAYILKKLNKNTEFDKQILRALNKALSFDERDKRYLAFHYKDAAFCYIVLNDYENARKYLKMALEVRKCNTCEFSKCADACGGMAMLFEAEENYAMAAAYYKEALALDQSDIRYIIGYKRVMEKLTKGNNSNEKKLQ